MFCRKWSGLPAEIVFPSDLKGLGYFINKDGEIRSIKNEDNYFKYFIDRNPRVCERQRFSMNNAVRNEIHNRLIAAGLDKVFLPLGVDDPAQPQIPIFISAGIADKSRVVLIFGETIQELGVLAQRVCGGPGGIEKGSLVSIVKALQEQLSSPTDPEAPGIILANMGELIWWPEGKRAVNRETFRESPMRSAAHIGNLISEQNVIPGHENPKAHVKYIFETVVPKLVDENAGLDIIGLGDGADAVESYLNDDHVWKSVGDRIRCLATVGGQFEAWSIKCDGFRDFLRERARAYVLCQAPLGTLISGPDSNPYTTIFTKLGCPVFSTGDEKHIEMLFIASHATVLGWLQEVALEPVPYKNPDFIVAYTDMQGMDEGWGGQANWVKNEDAAPIENAVTPVEMVVPPVEDATEGE